MSRFIAEYIHPTPACNEEDVRPLFASMNFMYFGKHRALSFCFVLSPILTRCLLVGLSQNYAN